MSKLMQYQRDALEVLRARLDPRDAAFRGTEDIRAKLLAIGPYLDDTIQLLEVIAEGGFHGQREYVARHAHTVRAARLDGALKVTAIDFKAIKTGPYRVVRCGCGNGDSCAVCSPGAND